MMADRTWSVRLFHVICATPGPGDDRMLRKQHRKCLISLCFLPMRDSKDSPVSASMSSTSKLVKRCLYVALYLILCSLLLLVRMNYETVVGTIFVGKSDNPRRSTNRSNYESFFHLERESIVDFNDLDVGGVVTTEVVQRKLRRVSETCEKYNLTGTLRRKHFLYSPRHGALYCWIRKVASTSFTKFFDDLRDRRVARNYYKEINFLAPQTLDDLKSIINDARVFKFLLVRHPFQRLVSSYRDRIEDNSRYTAQSWIYAPRIFRLTRPELFHSNATVGNGLQRIFDAYKRLELVPSFEEFVVWLLSEAPEKDDDHWCQYHKQCSVCDARFDYVLRLDNYTMNDVGYVFEKLGLDQDRAYLPLIQSTRGGKSDFARTCRYFGTLSRNLVERLYERYKVDFEMFDYEHESYLDCSAG